jgi:glutaredoxin
LNRIDVEAAVNRHGGAWRTTAALIGLALLVVAGAALAATTAQSQVYKWKDAKGQLHYGDTPPPQGAQALNTSARAPVDPSLPYELARAVRLHPVTLYTTTATPCGACDQGRSLLRARGIPFTEKTVNNLNDQQEQRRQTGKDELPLLVVGSRQLAGFQAAGWQEALDSASYPKQKMLPSGYQYAPAQPAAPAAAATNMPGGPVRAQIKVPPDEAAIQAEQARPHQTPPPAGNAPPGFQF